MSVDDDDVMSTPFRAFPCVLTRACVSMIEFVTRRIWCLGISIWYLLCAVNVNVRKGESVASIYLNHTFRFNKTMTQIADIQMTSCKPPTATPKLWWKESTFVQMRGAQLVLVAGLPKQCNIASCEMIQFCSSVGHYMVFHSKGRLCQSWARDNLLFVHPSNDTMSVDRFNHSLTNCTAYLKLRQWQTNALFC